MVPKQVSNLTIPYHKRIGDTTPQLYCRSQLIPKSLSDPRSAFLIVALPTTDNTNCSFDDESFKWYVIHSTDSPTTCVACEPI